MRYLLSIIIITLLISCTGKTEAIISAGEDGGANEYLDKRSEKYNELLLILDINYRNQRRSEDGKKYLAAALDFQQQEKYERAMDSYILACKDYNFGLAYYHLGLCLMDMKDYKSARKSFEKAISLFEFIDWDDTFGDRGIDDLYTYDDNNIKRETYFAYYNIACIESLQGNVDTAYEYLCEALFHGYPYINHIREDDDLHNLFKDRGRLRAIEAVYNAGSHNTVQGKIFLLHRPGYGIYVHFDGPSRLTEFISSQGPDQWGHENYEIKNYLIFSDVFRRYHRGFDYIKRFEGLDYYERNFEEKPYWEMYR